MVTQTSAVYTLTVYPTDTMLATFSTNTPLTVALGFFAVIAFCTFIFFMYDFFMRHDAHQRKAILEMKRRFVRFISHEIRTPLNTVCMGLELLESDLKDANDKAIRGEQDDDPHVDHCCALDGAANRKDDLKFWHQVTADVKENAQIAISILNDLLNYDKLEMGTLKLEMDTVCIWQLLECTIHQFRIQAVNNKIDLNLDILKPPLSAAAAVAAAAAEDYSSSDLELGCHDDTTTINVIGNEVRLGQVLRNVISNALKFTPAEGSIQVTAEYIPQGLPHATPISGKSDTLRATSYPRAGAIRIVVKDSGVGLSQEQLQMLFSEGVQFDPNRLQHGGGSGLGLTIAKGIVEQHGGTIHAESEGVGNGTSFIIELPLYHIPCQDLSIKKDGNIGSNGSDTARSDSCSTTTNGTLQVKKVLVVEDTKSSRKMLIRLLERDGHVCIPATNGQEAVDAIHKDIQETAAAAENGSSHGSSHHVPIDTILMDFEMPILKGPDATKQIRELGWTGTILGITGNVLEEDVEFFIQHGADKVLAKPVSLEHIKSYWDHEQRESALAMKRKRRRSLQQNITPPPVSTSKRNLTIPPQQQQQQPGACFSCEDEEDSVLEC